MQHSQIWRAIDALAERRGMTASGLARAAGLDPTTFNKSKRQGVDGKPRWPSTESVARALANRLVLRFLRHVLEPVDVIQLVDGSEPDFLERGVDRDRAQHVAVVDASDRGEPDVLRCIALGQLQVELVIRPRRFENDR